MGASASSAAPQGALHLPSTSWERRPFSEAHITVSGNIGAGKSTFCHALSAGVFLELMPENFELNPYLRDFYEDPVAHGFMAQLWFIEQAAKAQQELAARGRAVQDRCLYENAEVFTPSMLEQGHLSQSEAAALEEIYRAASAKIRPPDLHIHLEVPPEVCLQRIAQRGRTMEQAISLDYLRSLDDHYQRFISSWKLCPLVVIDATEIDARRPAFLPLVIERLGATWD